MNIHLSDKKCVACEAGTPPLPTEKVSELSSEVRDWAVSGDKKTISKLFQFKDFKEALGFVNKVGVLSEEEGHHPDMNLYGYRKVGITLSTHAIGGLSENDFILAAKINVLVTP